MDEERFREIAIIIARRELMKLKPPQQSDILQKWINDGAKEYDIPPEEFAAFVEKLLETVFDKTRTLLRETFLQKKTSRIGF